MLINSIFAFSAKPLYAIFYCGIFISIISFIFAIYISFRKLFANIGVEGWTSLLIAVTLFSGLILASIGIIAIYVSKIHFESKNEPFTIIRSEFSKKKGQDELG